jgi:hypothetical protein
VAREEEAAVAETAVAAAVGETCGGRRTEEEGELAGRGGKLDRREGDGCGRRDDGKADRC